MSANKKNKLKVLISISLIFVLFIGIFFLYTSDYYRADHESIQTFISESDVKKRKLYDGAFVYEINEGSEVGFIFYPGGKVEFTSYEPLMYELAMNGVTCVLVEMPFNLAFFNVNAASKVLDYFPNIKSWYIGGHSLGGSIAATFTVSNLDKIDGLVLLGSYSMSDFRNTDLKVLSIYGSEDRVMNMDNYEKYKNNLGDFLEVVIEGGCHGYFGMYGMQEDDGTPTITAAQQIVLTANYINDFIFK